LKSHLKGFNQWVTAKFITSQHFMVSEAYQRCYQYLIFRVILFSFFIVSLFFPLFFVILIIYHILLHINKLRLMQFTGRLPPVYFARSAYDNVTNDANNSKGEGGGERRLFSWFLSTPLFTSCTKNYQQVQSVTEAFRNEIQQFGLWLDWSNHFFFKKSVIVETQQLRRSTRCLIMVIGSIEFVWFFFY